MKDFFKFITNRVTIAAILILAQIAFFVAIVFFIPRDSNIQFWFTITLSALSLIIGLHVLGGDSNPGYKLSWIILIIVTPIFVCFYYLFYHQWSLKRTKRKKVEEIIKNRKEILPISEEPKLDNKNENYLGKSHWPSYENTKVTFFPTGEELLDEVLNKVRNAREYILIEFFIIKEGHLFEELLDILKQKANEGVEVKLLYDDLGSQDLPISFPKKMKKYGIEVVPFNPVKANINLHINHRDHRKIVIVDGKYAFTGGINIGDEYNNKKKRFGYWLDCGLLLQGDAIFSLTVTFFENWYFMTNKKVDLSKYKRDDKFETNYRVIPFGDSPLESENLSRNILLNLISAAKETVHICTPYLILDNELLTSLSIAAKSGIDVKIVIPNIPDKKTAYMVTKSFAYDLMRAGVKVYRYSPGFNHAKTFVFDSNKAMVGTTNLDYRSLYIHYENNILLYGDDCVMDINLFFENLFSESSLIPMSEARKPNIFIQILKGILRAFAPQL